MVEIKRGKGVIVIPKNQLPKDLYEAAAVCLGLSGEEVEIFARSIESGQAVFFTVRGTNKSTITGTRKL